MGNQKILKFDNFQDVLKTAVKTTFLKNWIFGYPKCMNFIFLMFLRVFPIKVIFF